MKILKYIASVLLVLVHLIPAYAIAANESADSVLPVVSTADGVTSANISGSINEAAANHLGSGFDLFVVYTQDNDGGTVDLSNLSDAKTIKASIKQKSDGTIDKNGAPSLDGPYPFSAKLSPLTPGKYIYQIVLGNPTLQFGSYNWRTSTARYVLTPQYFFDVSLPSVTQNYKLVGPVSTGGSLLGGYWADPVVTINDPMPGDYYIEIGVAQATGTADVHYNCVIGTNDLLSPLVGSKVSISGTGQKEIRSSDTFKLDAGLYCVGLKYAGPGGITQQVSVNGGGKYFLITTAGTPAIISIGGVKAPEGATLDQGANGNGCTTNEDNTTYCLLAPLPGVGDPSGKLDVAKGIGDYINTIIRLLFGLIGVLSVLMIVIGGVEYMSTVNIGEKEGAKERITSALFGLILALASYLILNTINPNLVNLSIVVQQVSVATDETDETGGTVPNSLPPVTGITVPPTTNAATGATIVLQNKNIVPMGKLGTEDDRSSAKQNITDTAAGNPGWTTVGGRQVSLDQRIFTGMLTMANVYPIKVNFILGGTHSQTSLHYQGKAYDVQASPSDTTRNTRLMDACRAAGATEIIGPCSNNLSEKICKATGYATNGDHQTHIHCGWR